ncbi:MAG: sugar ABC transporter substrate-binding protein [Anaerolineae bacterium]|nr:sugar ABC transporter substrate-binding protein [Anaerolineae bacterium]
MVLCIMFCVLLLTSCASSSPSPDTISFMVFGEPAELAAYQRLVAAFEAQYPEIDIELRHVPGQGDYRQKLAADFAAGSPPDVMLLNYRRFASFAGREGLEPLGDYLAKSSQLHEEDFFAMAIASFYWDEQLWCIPQNISSLVVYYNRDLFDAAGVPYPADDWTWDDFLALARALTRDVDGDGVIDEYGAGIDPNLFRLAPFIWQNGGELVAYPVSGDQNPTRLSLDTPAALEAFQWFVDLQVREHVVPDAVAEAAESGETRFLNGRLAMYFNSRRGVPTYRTIEDFAWDVAPLPRRVQAAGILHSDGYCMAARAANKDAAWMFIEFSNSVAGQTLVAATGRTVPSLRTVAESPAFLDPTQPPANNRVYVDTLSTLKRVPVMVEWAAIEETTGREIERAFYGDVPVAEAAAAAIAYTQAYFEP